MLLIPRVCLDDKRIEPTHMHSQHKGYSPTGLERKTIAKQRSIVCIVILSKTSVSQGRWDTLKHTNESDGTYSNKLSTPLARREEQLKV